MSQSDLLSVSDLWVNFRTTEMNESIALRGVDLEVGDCETVGIVGESGSGKSTLANAILGLVPVKKGSIQFAGEEISQLHGTDRLRLGKDLQAIFQDPFSSLNPSRTVRQAVAEGLTGGPDLSKSEVHDRVAEILDQVSLPSHMADRYPGALSGGQRQRVAIARAVIGSPRLVICDEVTTALDLSVKAQVLNLLQEFQTKKSLSYLFIGHELPVVRYISHRMLVMFRGSIVETGTSESVYSRPRHPYTRSLLAASPVPDPVMQRERRLALRSLSTPKIEPMGLNHSGCVYAARCQYAITKCFEIAPTLEKVDPDTKIACWRSEEI